jgi:hypothetical protein
MIKKIKQMGLNTSLSAVRAGLWIELTLAHRFAGTEAQEELGDLLTQPWQLGVVVAKSRARPWASGARPAKGKGAEWSLGGPVHYSSYIYQSDKGFYFLEPDQPRGREAS